MQVDINVPLYEMSNQPLQILWPTLVSGFRGRSVVSSGAMD